MYTLLKLQLIKCWNRHSNCESDKYYQAKTAVIPEKSVYILTVQCNFSESREPIE